MMIWIEHNQFESSNMVKIWKLGFEQVLDTLDFFGFRLLFAQFKNNFIRDKRNELEFFELRMVHYFFQMCRAQTCNDFVFLEFTDRNFTQSLAPEQEFGRCEFLQLKPF